MIVFRPFKFLYLINGLLMLIWLLGGYAICFVNIAFLANTKCTKTTYARTGGANTLIFLVIASFVLVFAHVIIWFSFL
jgi:hypothetical protein